MLGQGHGRPRFQARGWSGCKRRMPGQAAERPAEALISPSEERIVQATIAGGRGAFGAERAVLGAVARRMAFAEGLHA